MVFARWLVLIRGLVASQKVNFDPTAATAVQHVIRELTGYRAGSTHLREITIPQLWRGLSEPSPELIKDCRYASKQHFLDSTRSICDAIGVLVNGHLAGLFDAPTTIDVDWRAPIQSLSLSRLKPLGDEAIGVALTCLNSWGRAMTQVAEPGDLRIIVRDEAWKQMRLGLDAVLSLDADLRLSRDEGCIQVVSAHKPSDMLTVGDAGSQAVAIATDLLHLCATKILLGQDDKIGTDLTDLLGLGPMAEHLVTHWANGGRGRALWVAGDRQFKVAGVLTPQERQLTYTNDAINGDSSGCLSMDSSSSRAWLAVPAGFVLAALTLLLVFAGVGGGSAAATPAGCGPAGTATTVAGIALTAEQMGNAQTVATVTASRGLSSYAAVIAEATAYQESRLINLDHGDTAGPDSRGLFQQRPSQGWGTPAQVLDPTYATNAFLDALLKVPNWQTIPLTVAAQTVQVSAYPDAYAQWQALGEGLVGLLWPQAAAGSGGAPTAVRVAATTNRPAAAATSVTTPAGFDDADPAGRQAVPGHRRVRRRLLLHHRADHGARAWRRTSSSGKPWPGASSRSRTTCPAGPSRWTTRSCGGT